jgi:type III restriction enzyme
MKLHFDSNQEYQMEAVRAVTDIFEGQPLSGCDFEFSLTQTGALRKKRDSSHYQL